MFTFFAIIHYLLHSILYIKNTVIIISLAPPYLQASEDIQIYEGLFFVVFLIVLILLIRNVH